MHLCCTMIFVKFLEVWNLQDLLFIYTCILVSEGEYPLNHTINTVCTNFYQYCLLNILSKKFCAYVQLYFEKKYILGMLENIFAPVFWDLRMHFYFMRIFHSFIKYKNIYARYLFVVQGQFDFYNCSMYDSVWTFQAKNKHESPIFDIFAYQRGWKCYFAPEICEYCSTTRFREQFFRVS